MLCPLKSCKKNGCHCVKDYGIFLGFFILALIIWIFKLNQTLFQYINSLHSLLPDAVWKGFNFIAYAKYFILPLLLLIITFIWRRDKLKQIIILIIAYYLVFETLKVLFGEARPYIVLPEGTFFWISSADAVKSAYRSFPSGHTGNMAVFVFALSSMFYKKWLKVLLLLLLLLTGLARICSGWHWPLDVVVSGLIGYVLVQVCLCRKVRVKAKASS